MSSLVGNASKILIGQVLAISITLLTLPIITRLYTPELYGAFLILSSILAAIAPISCLGFEKAVLIPKSRRTITNLIIVAICANGLVAGLFVLFIFIGGNWLTQLLAIPTDSSLLLVLPVGIIVFGNYRIITFISIRNNKFTKQAVAQVSESSFERIIGLFGGLIGPSAWWLIVARLVGIGSGALVLLPKYNRSSVYSNYKKLLDMNWRRLFVTCRHYVNFILSSIAAVLNSFSKELPLLTFGILYSPEIVAYYGLGRAVVGRPLGMIGDSLSKAFFYTAADTKRRGESLTQIAINIVKYPVILALPPVIIILVTSDIFIPVVFGSKWTEAGLFLQVMAIPFLFMFIYRPISILFEVQQKQRVRLILNIALVVLIVCGVIIGSYQENALLSVILVAAASITIYAIGILYLLSITEISCTKVFIILFRIIGVSLIFMAPLILVRLLLENNITLAIISGSLGLILYYYYMYRTDDLLSDSIKKLHDRFTGNK